MPPQTSYRSGTDEQNNNQVAVVTIMDNSILQRPGTDTCPDFVSDDTSNHSHNHDVPNQTEVNDKTSTPNINNKSKASSSNSNRMGDQLLLVENAAGSIDNACPAVDLLELFNNKTTIPICPILLRRADDGSSVDVSEAVDDPNDPNHYQTTTSHRRKHRREIILEYYTNFIQKYRWVLLGFIIAVVWPLGACTFLQIHKLTDSTFHPVKGSLSDIARNAFQTAYAFRTTYPSNATANTTDTNRTDTSNDNNISTIATATSVHSEWNSELVRTVPLILLLEETKPNVHDDFGDNESELGRVRDDVISDEHDLTSPARHRQQYKHSPVSFLESPMTSDPRSPAYQQAYNFSVGLYDYLMNKTHNCWKWPGDKECNDEIWLRVTDYYTLQEQELHWLAENLKSPAGNTALIVVEYILPGHHIVRDKKERINQLMQAIDNYKSQFFFRKQKEVYRKISNSSMGNEEVVDSEEELRSSSKSNDASYFTVRSTGIDYFLSDLLQSLETDIIRMDVMAVPLALILIGMVLPASNPCYVWIIPSMTIITTASVWSILFYAIAMMFPSFQISSYAPIVMMSLSLGVGIDYTLFLLARYLEEMTSYGTNHTQLQPQRQRRFLAIRNTLKCSGHVLVLSGLTLAGTLVALLMLPLGILQSIGLFSFIAILSSLFVNLTLVPALLFTNLGNKIIASTAKSSIGIDNNNGNHTRDINSNSDNNETINHDIHTNELHEGTGQQHTSQFLGTNNELTEEGGLDAPLLRDNYDQVNGINELDYNSSNPRNIHPLLLGSSRPPTQLTAESVWYRLARHLLHPYKGIIILLIAFQLLTPVAQRAMNVRYTLSFDLLLPAKSPSLMTYHHLEQQVGEKLNFYRILFDGHAANITMTSIRGFDVMHSVVSSLRSIDHDALFFEVEEEETGMLSSYSRACSFTKSNEIAEDVVHQLSAQICSETTKLTSIVGHGRPTTIYNGISVLQNTAVPHSVFVLAKSCSEMKPYCPMQLLHTLDYVDKTATSHDNKATTMIATLANTDPFSDDGIAWLNSARERVRRLEHANLLHGVQVHFMGAAGVEYDAVDAVYKAFPRMIVTTIIAVFALMGFFFKSIFPPLRSVISISITVSFSFGLAVMVFQDNVLTNMPFIGMAVSVSQHELCWVVPILAFSIMVGLSMDYDVFLISRILEYRMKSYEHKTSIASGLHSTGGIISAAGVIMSISFGSLMFSSNPVLYQWSFLLTSAVLLDTFVVRTVVVPILTNLAGPKYCWWPRKFPSTNQICLEEYQSSEADDVSGILRTLEETSEYEPLRTSHP